jgi:hypothetical protein
VRGEPEWTRLPASTPTAVRTVVRRCLEKDRRLRIRDIGDALLAMDGAFEPPQQSGPRQMRAVWAIGISGVIVAVGAAATAMWRGTPPANDTQMTRFLITLPEAPGPGFYSPSW